MKRHIVIFVMLLLHQILLANNIKVIFRYDDFLLQTDAINERVVRNFQKHHIPLVLGVIPCNANEKSILAHDYPFLPTLKQAVSNHSIEIALHGLNHIKIKEGEFGKLSIEEQYRRMVKGKTILDSVFLMKIAAFIPPWNAYDDNTLIAIEKAGMTRLSSALCVGQSFSYPHITYLPETVEDFEGLPAILSHNKNRNCIVVVMFHSYTFSKKFSLSKLDTLLSTIQKDSHIQCVTFQDIYKSGEIVDKGRMEANMESNLLSKLLHLQGAIQTTSFAYRIRALNILAYMLWCLFISILSSYYFKSKKISFKLRILYTIPLLLVVAIIVFTHLLAPLKLLLLASILASAWPLLLKLKTK